MTVEPIVFASRVSSLWAAVALVSLAAAAHQGWSANLFTVASIRFHIGLEDVSDLIADLERGFAAMAVARG